MAIKGTRKATTSSKISPAVILPNKRKEKLTHLFDGLTKDDAITIMSKCDNIGEFLYSIDERIGGSGYKRFYAFCSKYNINYNDYFKYDIIHPINRNKSIDEILVENSTYFNSNRLRKRLIKEGIFERKCYCCGLKEWNGQPISLELEHKNGNNRDHRLSNLDLLCPNCHAQTKTYRGRNKKRT